MKEKTISVVMPVYNEIKTIDEIISRVLSQLMVHELIIVDDCSTDGTREKLKNEYHEKNDERIKIYFHNKNKGKGSAMRTGISKITGDIIILQDADLEYDPNDYEKLIKPIIAKKVDLVNGSRFMSDGTNVIKTMTFGHVIKNKLITLLCNIVNNIYITDLTSCYKAFSRDILQHIQFTSEGFIFETELISRASQARIRMCEMPISYSFRTSKEGKKIKFFDGIKCAFWLLSFFFQNKVRDIYLSQNKTSSSKNVLKGVISEKCKL